jgi:hypothetical protein
MTANQAAHVPQASFCSALPLLLLLQVMPASHIPLLYLTNSLLQTFLTAPLSKLSSSSIQASIPGFRADA